MNNENSKDDLRYCVYWNVEINGRNLYDHDFEIHNERWNTKLNGIRIMHFEKDEKKRDNWNVCLSTEEKKKTIPN